MRLKLLGLSLLLIGNSAYGLTLTEAVQTALKKNNQLKAKKIEIKEKVYDYKSAKAQLFPKVELYTNYNKTTDPPYAIMNRMEAKKLDTYATDFNDPGKSQLFKTGLKVEVPIWMGGKIRTAIDLRKKEVKATKEQYKRDENRVIMDVVNAYYGVLTAKAFVETAQLAVRDAQRHLKDAETAYRAGVGIKSDVLRAKVYLEQMEENLVKAKAQYQIALRALNTAMGLYPNTEITVEGDLIYKPYDFNLQELIEEAYKHRPELKELQVRYAQTKDLEKLAKAEFMPQLGAFGEIFAASSKAPWDKENSSWVVGVQASINLFSGGEKFYKLRKSKLEQLKVREFQEQAKKGIAFEVSRAYFNFVSAKKRVELAKVAIASAQESLRIVEKRYKNGLATITELLDTQTALNQARSNFVAALSNYQTAVAKVYYAAGLLPLKYQDLLQ